MAIFNSYLKFPEGIHHYKSHQCSKHSQLLNYDHRPKQQV